MLQITDPTLKRMLLDQIRRASTQAASTICCRPGSAQNFWIACGIGLRAI